MQTRCECRERHLRRRIVLTGGPGAGKTAVLELLRHSLCEHVLILPEAAGVIFGGGLPRHPGPGSRCAAQRAIYHVQLELEAESEADGGSITLCDRAAIDGYAYWPGPEDFWSSVGTTRQATLNRYDAVIHLRVPAADGGYGHQNPLRVESASEARRKDDRILEAWDGHPRRYVVEPTGDFMERRAAPWRFFARSFPRAAATTHRMRSTRRRRRIMYSRHEEYEGKLKASPDQLFELLDDQTRLSAHMTKRSWKMGWGKTDILLDEKRGKAVGSHIVLRGRVFGIPIYLDEVVTLREPPLRKNWETVDQPRLLVIGPYRMGFTITSAVRDVSLRVEIDYDFPQAGFSRLLGRFFGPSYAKWCTEKMVRDAQRVFGA